MKLQALAPGVFDLVVLVIVIIGLARGKSRGMSQELLDVLLWLAIIFGGGALYKGVGQFISQYTHISLLFGYIWSYLGIAALIALLFGAIKRAVGEKLVGSDVFGRLEFILGTLAGGVRFACMVVFAVSLLNSKYISPKELADMAKMQQQSFGSISFPTIGSMQSTVFQESITGPFLRKYLNAQLITPTPYDPTILRREGPGKRLENELNDTFVNPSTKK